MAPTFMNYFDSSRINLTYSFEWTLIMEMHVITKATNPHVYFSAYIYNNVLKLGY
jgi:hypothetical protein